MSPPNLAEVNEALRSIVSDADRAKAIVDRMRYHIKKSPPRREPFDLTEAIEEVIGMVRSESKPRAMIGGAKEGVLEGRRIAAPGVLTAREQCNQWMARCPATALPLWSGRSA